MKAARRFSGMSCKIDLLIPFRGCGGRGEGERKQAGCVQYQHIFSRRLDSRLYSETFLSRSLLLWEIY